MSFQIRVEPAAERNLARLDLAIQRQFVELIRQLPGEIPGHQVGQPLKGARSLRLIEAGGCRVIYIVSRKEHSVHVLAVSRIQNTPDSYSS